MSVGIDWSLGKLNVGLGFDEHPSEGVNISRCIVHDHSSIP